MNDAENGRSSNPNRREFLKLGGAVTAALMGQTALASTTMDLLISNPKTADAMPTRNLGKTGHRVGIFSLGGQAALEHAHNEAVAVPMIERALDLGVNYIDMVKFIWGAVCRGAGHCCSSVDQNQSYRAVWQNSAGRRCSTHTIVRSIFP